MKKYAKSFSMEFNTKAEQVKKWVNDVSTKATKNIDEVYKGIASKWNKTKNYVVGTVNSLQLSVNIVGAVGYNIYQNSILKDKVQNIVNFGNGIKEAFSGIDNFKNALLGIGSSALNGGLNLARLTLTALSCQPENTWEQLGEPIDFVNEKINENYVTNQDVFQSYSTLTDAAQMASLTRGFSKGGMKIKSPSYSSSFINAGTGINMGMFNMSDELLLGETQNILRMSKKVRVVKSIQMVCLNNAAYHGKTGNS